MIINKDDEPFFHNLLSIAKAIFKEANSKNILLYGKGHELKFVSGNYAGKFSYQTERLDADYYDFGNSAYEISSLPNDDIKLEPLDYLPCNECYLENVEKLFSAIDIYSKSYLEIFKGDECKIAKILATTGCWLNDDALKYLNKFKYMDIYACEETKKNSFYDYTSQEYNPEFIAVYQELELDGGQTNLAATLIFNTRYNPRTGTYSQEKIMFYQDEKEIDTAVEIEVETDETYEAHENEEKELDEMFNALEEELAIQKEKDKNEFDPMLA